MLKKIMTALLLLIATIAIGVGAGKIIMKAKFLEEINISELDTSKYIKYTDEVSHSKAQVNWKKVACIIAVIHENEIAGVTEEEIKSVAELFLNKTKDGYKIFSLEEVIAPMQLKDKEIERLNNYILDLENHGVMPERLDPNEKYVKFINSIKDEAIQNYKDSKILPSITISQAILESSWGNQSYQESTITYLE